MCSSSPADDRQRWTSQRRPSGNIGLTAANCSSSLLARVSAAAAAVAMARMQSWLCIQEDFASRACLINCMPQANLEHDTSSEPFSSAACLPTLLLPSRFWR